jgi:hypothetical protein
MGRACTSIEQPSYRQPIATAYNATSKKGSSDEADRAAPLDAAEAWVVENHQSPRCQVGTTAQYQQHHQPRYQFRSAARQYWQQNVHSDINLIINNNINIVNQIYQLTVAIMLDSSAVSARTRTGTNCTTYAWSSRRLAHQQRSAKSHSARALEQSNVKGESRSTARHFGFTQCQSLVIVSIACRHHCHSR